MVRGIPASFRQTSLDINGRRLLVYRDPQAGDYANQQALGPADAVSPLAAPAAVVRVADLLV
jgi:hypothetical protein